MGAPKHWGRLADTADIAREHAMRRQAPAEVPAWVQS
jgi:hypothetical protein